MDWVSWTIQRKVDDVSCKSDHDRFHNSGSDSHFVQE